MGAVRRQRCDLVDTQPAPIAQNPVRFMTHFERKNLARVLTVIMELDAAIEDLSIHVAADGLCRVTFTLREGESLPDLPGIPDTEP